MAGTLVAGALLAPDAGLAAGWTPAQDVTGGGTALPAVAADGPGNVALAFQQGDGVAGAVRPAGGAFAAGGLAGVGEAPAIAASPGGQFLAGWSADAERIEFAAGPGLAERGSIANPGPAPAEVTVAVNDAGAQWIAWVTANGTVRVSSRAAGGQPFGAPDSVSAAGAEGPILAASSGGVHLVWLRRSETTAGSVTTVQTRIERLTLGAPAPVTLEQATHTIDESDDSEDGSELGPPQLVAGAGGAPTAAWTRDSFDPSDPDAVTVAVQASADGGPVQTLTSTGATIGGIAVDAGPDGTAAVTWDESDGLATAVRVSRRGPGGAFGAPETVATGGVVDPVAEPQVAIRAPAQPLVAWLRSVGAGVDRLEAAIADGPGFAPVGGPLDAGVEDPALAADGEGNVVAAWTGPSGADRVVRAAAYDAVGPRLDALAVPAGGNVGQSLSFSVAPFDTWSAIAAVRWIFGDGQTADGAQVTHAYGRAGTFDASVTASDATGNETAGPARQVQVVPAGEPTPTPTPPPVGGGPADTTAPVVSQLALAQRCIVAGSGTPIQASFTLSEDARMLYSIRRRRESPPKRRCPGPSRRNRPGTSEEAGRQEGQGTTGNNVATIAVRRGPQSARAWRGRNRVRLAQLTAGLAPGTYQLIVRATDRAGNRSVDAIVKLWVLRPPR